MYSREIDGQEYTFGVSGKLIRNVLVMYDRQTNTLWSQLLGEAVEGPLVNTKLEFLPAQMTTWEEWKTAHPDSLALKKGYSGDRDSYDAYYASSQTGVIDERYEDDRLYVKEFVIGVELDSGPVAFPFSVLNNEPVVNYDQDDDRILVYFNIDAGTGIAFSRVLDGQTLTFESIDNETITDLETGTIWRGQTGEAIEGPLAGSQLEIVKHTMAFWFGWKDIFPYTQLYGIE